MKCTGPTSTAKLLWPHLEGRGWRELAEIAHPGVNRRITAVETGDATTATLPAEVAVRLLRELDPTEATAAAHGDRRASVRAAFGVAATAPKAPSTLLAGTPAEVDATLAERTRISNPAVLTEYLAADVEIRDIAAPHLIAAGTPEIGAGAALELAARGRATAVVTRMLAGAAAGTFRPQTSWWRTARKVRTAAATAATAAGMEPVWPLTGSGGEPATSRTAPATLDRYASADLAGAAVTVGCALRCDPATGAAAARHIDPRAAAGRERSRVLAAFITAGISGAAWSDVTHLAARGDTTAFTAEIFDAAIGAGVPATFIADAAAGFFTADARHGHFARADGARILEHCGNLLDPVTAARVCLAPAAKNPTLLVNWLAGNHGDTPSVEAVRDLLEHPAARGHLTSLGAGAYTSTGITAAASTAETLTPLWDALVKERPCAEVVAAANAPAATGLAAAFARHVDAAIDDTDAPAGTWAAVCTLAGNFDGTVDELVDVAAGAAPDVAA